MEHVTAHQILTDKQYGFRPIVEEIQLAMDHYFSVELIFIDFKKAFDTVPHERLMKKLHHYGIQGNPAIQLDIQLANKKNTTSCY